MLVVALQRRQIRLTAVCGLWCRPTPAIRFLATGARHAPPSPAPRPVYSAKAAPRHAVNPIRAVTAIRSDRSPRRHAARAFWYPRRSPMIDAGTRSRRDRVAPPTRVRLRGGCARPRRRDRRPGRGRPCRPISAASGSRSRSSPPPWTPWPTPTSRSASSRHGGVAFVNLEGLYTRYEDATPIIERVAAAESGQAAAHILAEAYEQPVRDELIRALITRIKAQGAIAAVATTPASAWHHAEVAAAGGRRPVPRPVPGQQRPSHLDLDPRALARRPHRWPAAARAGREHGERRGRLPAHAPGRGRHLRRRRPRRGLHDARGPRHRRAAGLGHARGGRRARPVRARDRAATSRSSPMAA